MSPAMRLTLALPCLALMGALAVMMASPSCRRATETGSVSRGYSIPLIDLAGDTARQVVVDREPGQYLGHPTTVLLEDGRTIIAVYPEGHGRSPIVMKRSADGGLNRSNVGRDNHYKRNSSCQNDRASMERI